MVVLLPPGGAGPRTFQCLDCDRQDTLESVSVKRWLEGELGRGLLSDPSGPESLLSDL